MRKKVLLLVVLMALLTVLSGCGDLEQPINSESVGFWNEYVIYPLSQMIIFFAEVLGNSYGLSIIVVTIIIRTVLLPLNIKQLKSSKAMQDIQPELQKIREKYSSKDQKTQQKLQQETMELFQKNGVNPLAGCFPLLVQMPILFGIYQAIYRTEEIKTQSFLWFQMGQPDPIFLLPIIAAITTFLQQKIMMAGNASANNPQMKMMLYMMPLMIGIFAVYFPAALALYWVVGNVFMIGQAIFVNRPMNKQSTGGAKK
ncbi:YidC family membrane integrase SpoIIIJ [Bacillaceae bacterium S4-13-58]